MHVEEALERLRRPLLAAVGLAAFSGAAASRFVQDDAFISFAYARSLAEGHGLTWFGERVEGYTNQLWVLLLAVGFRAGWDPVLLSQGLGLLSFVAVLWLVPRLVGAGEGSTLAALVGLLLVSTNASVRWYATGGLETMLQAALATAVLALALGAFGDPMEGGRPVQVSLLSGAAMLTRLDSAVLVVVPGGLLLARAWREPGTTARVARLVLPGGALVALSFAFRFAAYGELLPNTFAAKVGGGAMTGNGLLYVGRFSHVYLLWPLLGAGVAALVRSRRRPGLAMTALAATSLLWLVYVVAVGGDFMEFRFLVPAAPALLGLVALLVVGAGRDLGRPVLVSALALSCAAGASIHHVRTFRGTTPDFTLDSVPALATFYGLYPDGDFSPVGEALGEELRGVDVRVATSATGAVPFYSRVPAVDLLGLNDREVAREGVPAPASYTRPGHRRRATLSTLRHRGVNLVLGDPTVASRGWLSDPAHARDAWGFVASTMGFAGAPVPEARVVGIPVGGSASLLAWVLSSTPALDARIRERGWEDVRIGVRRPR